MIKLLAHRGIVMSDKNLELREAAIISSEHLKIERLKK